MRASRAPVNEVRDVERRYCGARRTRGGEDATCTRPAGWGTSHPGFGNCKWHAGSTFNGRRAAQLEQARGSLERLGVPLAGVNPLDLLGDLVDQPAGVPRGGGARPRGAACTPRRGDPDRMVRAFLAALADPELGLSAEQLEAAPRVAARLIRACEVG